MVGMQLLSKDEKIQVIGGACPFSKEFIQQEIKKYLDAGLTDMAAEFIRYVYELGCTGR